MAGDTAGELLENNHLILNLNEPSQLEDTSWIRPGKVIREVSLSTEGGKACVDFAVKYACCTSSMMRDGMALRGRCHPTHARSPGVTSI